MDLKHRTRTQERIYARGFAYIREGLKIYSRRPLCTYVQMSATACIDVCNSLHRYLRMVDKRLFKDSGL